MGVLTSAPSFQIRPNLDITSIIEAAVTLMAAIVTAFIIPWIKSRITASRWQNLQDWAKVSVNAAEVLFKGTGLGKDKLKYVTEYLTELCSKNGVEFDEITIRQAIENAWKDMTEAQANLN